MRKILSLILCSLISLTALTGCDNKLQLKSVEYKISDEFLSPENELIAENTKYRLKWDKNTAGVILENIETGIQWGTSPIASGEVQYDELGMPIKRHPQVESPIAVNYIDSTSGEEQSVLAYTGSVTTGNINCTEKENGLKIEYYFDDVKIMVPVEYTLLENGVQISVNSKEIQESENKVTQISVAPFMCSAENTATDSYLLFPSGSGAVIEPEAVSQTGLSYSSAVYGDDSANGASDSISVTQKVSLPVYGVKIGDKALFSVIDGSAESAIIETSVGSTSIGYSSVFATFQVRGYYNHIADVFQWSKIHRQVFAEKINTVMSVSFYPIEGEKANYSGMAEFYRNMLIENSDLPDKSEETPFNLIIVGGALIKRSFLGIPYTELYAATTLKEAQKIVETVQKETDSKFTVKLKGFGESGVDINKLAGGYKIGKELGSLSDLNDFSEYCEKSGIDLYTEMDLVRFSKSTNGFNSYFDAATNSGDKKVYQYTHDVALRTIKNETRYVFLSRNELFNAADELLNETKEWKLGGIDISSLGDTAYSDYSDESSADYYAKSNMAKDVSEIILKLKNSGKRISSSNANLYAAVMSDLITDVPSTSDRADIFKYDIPFYQMVFKGCVPITSEVVNGAESDDNIILRAIESGCSLNFNVIANWDNNLIDADYPLFFASLFENMSPQLYDTVIGLKDYFESISCVKIKEHKVLDNGLRETVYENGVHVFVNYSESELTSPLGVVSPHGYLVGG